MVLEETHSELDGLDKRNRELRAELDSVETEIKYLKNLIAEIQDRSRKK
jgi:peptidoglycan hydrolase CwlO-like protein